MAEPSTTQTRKPGEAGISASSAAGRSKVSGSPKRIHTAQMLQSSRRSPSAKSTRSAKLRACIFPIGPANAAQSNVGIEQMLRDMQQEMLAEKAAIANAEQRAETAQQTAEKAQAEQASVEGELHNAKLELGGERVDRERDVVTAQATIGALRGALQPMNRRITAQNTVTDKIGSLSDELRQAKTTMQTQHDDIKILGAVTDDMFDRINELTAAFHEIAPSEKPEGNDNGHTTNVFLDAVNVDRGVLVHVQSIPINANAG